MVMMVISLNSLAPFFPLAGIAQLPTENLIALEPFFLPLTSSFRALLTPNRRVRRLWRETSSFRRFQSRNPRTRSCPVASLGGSRHASFIMSNCSRAQMCYWFADCNFSADLIRFLTAQMRLMIVVEVVPCAELSLPAVTCPEPDTFRNLLPLR